MPKEQVCSKRWFVDVSSLLSLIQQWKYSTWLRDFKKATTRPKYRKAKADSRKQKIKKKPHNHLLRRIHMEAAT